MIIHAAGEAAPVAQVMLLPNEITTTIGWKNELQVAASVGDIRAQTLYRARRVCVVDNFRARIGSRELEMEIGTSSVPLTDSPGAREAFSAALLHHLLRIGRRDLTQETLKWATAAMATNLSIDITTDAMPKPSDVGWTLESDQSVG